MTLRETNPGPGENFSLKVINFSFKVIKINNTSDIYY